MSRLPVVGVMGAVSRAFHETPGRPGQQGTEAATRPKTERRLDGGGHPADFLGPRSTGAQTRRK